MELKDRVIRFSVALTIAGAIAVQMPMTSGIATADGYGGRGGLGDTGHNIVRGVVAIAVGYGLYSTATSGIGKAGSTVSTDAAGVDKVAPPGGQQAKDNVETMWDVLNGREDMNEFAKLADQAGLKEALRKAGEFTAFIPNNAAIADLGEKELQELMKDKAKLTDFLEGHIIKGKYTIDELKTLVKNAPNGKEFETINGKKITIKLDGDTLSIGGIRVIETDIPASNANIHPIGRALGVTPPATP